MDRQPHEVECHCQSLCGSEVTSKIKPLEIERWSRAPVPHSWRRHCMIRVVYVWVECVFLNAYFSRQNAIFNVFLIFPMFLSINRFECIIDQELVYVASYAPGRRPTLRVYSPGGSTFLTEITSRSPSCKRDVKSKSNSVNRCIFT